MGDRALEMIAKSTDGPSDTHRVARKTAKDVLEAPISIRDRHGRLAASLTVTELHRRPGRAMVLEIGRASWRERV